MWPVDDIFIPPVITWLCHDTISARMAVGHSLLLVRLPRTRWVTICVIRRLALTVSDVCLRFVTVCFQSMIQRIGASRGIIGYIMRYINLRLTYLLTYVYCQEYAWTVRKTETPKVSKRAGVFFKNRFLLSPLIIRENGNYSSIYIIKGDMCVCLFVSMLPMAGRTAGPMKTKLGIGTHVDPRSVLVKVKVKAIYLCVRYQKFMSATPGE